MQVAASAAGNYFPSYRWVYIDYIMSGAQHTTDSYDDGPPEEDRSDSSHGGNGSEDDCDLPEQPGGPPPSTAEIRGLDQLLTSGDGGFPAVNKGLGSLSRKPEKCWNCHPKRDSP